MKKLLLLAFFASSSAASFAACENARTHLDYNLCVYDYNEAAFKKLSKTYVKVLNAQDDDRKVHLRQAQNAWWKFKDVECDSPIVNFGGTGEGASLACKADKAIIREKELRDIYL